MGAFPTSGVASALGYACLLFSIGAVFFEMAFGGKGFAIGFSLGALAGFIWGAFHPGTFPSPGGLVGALSGGVGGAIVGAIYPLLCWPVKLFRPPTDKNKP